MERFTLLFAAVTTLACLTSFGYTVITTYVALLVLSSSRISGLALTASVAQILAAFSLITLTAVFLWRTSGRTTILVWLPGVLSYLVGISLGFAALGFTIHLSNEGRLLARYNYDSPICDLAKAGLACGSIGLIPHIIFYALICPRSMRTVSETRQEMQEKTNSPSRSDKRQSINMQMSSLLSASPDSRRAYQEPISPAFSAFSLSPRPSLRDAIRPVTSRTRLLLGTSFASLDSRSLHSSEPAAEFRRGNDDFGSWDTSNVQEVYETSLPLKDKARKLETIPGSRPVSPAHEIESCLSVGIAENVPIPESPTQLPVAHISTPMETVVTHIPAYAESRRSSSIDQSHIHPLFRAVSPVPPPLISPGTVITASPRAGQVVSPEIVLGVRPITSPNGSRPSTPTFVFGPAKSQPASMKSFHITSPTPRDNLLGNFSSKGFE